VFNFGIDGYQPQWISGRSAITGAHGHRLRSLTGRTLTRTWLAWDLDDDTWWADCPILLDFDGEQVEINHQKFNDLSITWNTANPAQTVAWPTTGNYRLAWREDPRPELTALHGQTLRGVELLEWTGDDGDLANGMVALGFTLTSGHLTIYNALDENGIEFHPPTANYRRHPLN
jgi:hypothetical protein